MLFFMISQQTIKAQLFQTNDIVMPKRCGAFIVEKLLTGFSANSITALNFVSIARLKASFSNSFNGLPVL